MSALGRGGFVALERDLLVLREEERLHAALDRIAGDDDLPDVRARRDLVHHVEEYLLDDRPETAGTGLPFRRALGGRLKRIRRELELDLVEREELLVLLHDRVLRLGEDTHEVAFVE